MGENCVDCDVELYLDEPKDERCQDCQEIDDAKAREFDRQHPIRMNTVTTAKVKKMQETPEISKGLLDHGWKFIGTGRNKEGEMLSIYEKWHGWARAQVPTTKEGWRTLRNVEIHGRIVTKAKEDES